MCGVMVGQMFVQSGRFDRDLCYCVDEEVPEQPYYFKCVSRYVSESGAMVSAGKYSSLAEAQAACLSGDDLNAEFYKYLSGGTLPSDCNAPEGQMCPVTPAYFIRYACSTEPPKHASGAYGSFDEFTCTLVAGPHGD